MGRQVFSISDEPSYDALDQIESDVRYPGENGKDAFDRAFFEIRQVMFMYDGVDYAIDLYTTEQFCPELDEVVRNGGRTVKNRRGNRLMLGEFDRIKKNAPGLLSVVAEYMNSASLKGTRLKVFITHGVRIIDDETGQIEWGASISRYARTPDGDQPFREQDILPAMSMNQAINALQTPDTEALLCLCCNPGGFPILPNQTKVSIIYYKSVNAPTGEASQLGIIEPEKL